MKEYLSTPEGVKQMWDKINEVLDNFDFTKVAATMEVLDWGWACTEREAEMYEAQGCKTRWRGDDGGWIYYPEYSQLLKQARELMVQCIEDMAKEGKNEWSISTGGFMIKAYICTDDERRDYYGSVADVDDFAHSVDLSLYFIVEESTSY